MWDEIIKVTILCVVGCQLMIGFLEDDFECGVINKWLE